MKFESTTLGSIEVSPDTIITFPEGLIGLEDCKRYSLFHEDKENPIVFWLQSLDEPDITFSVIDPAILGIRYEITLDGAETALIEREASDDIAVLMIVRKANDLLDSNVADSDVKANAIAPLVINMKTRLGLQKCTAVCELVFRNENN